MEKDSKIFVAGHRGLVGSAILSHLHMCGFKNLVIRSRAELDLCSQNAVNDFFASERPEYVFVAAARVGGIHANNSFPADFIRDNLLIQTLVLDAAYRYGAEKVQILGSSCIYPKLAPQPMKEEYLLTGKLEPTNEPYAVAKIAGIEMAQAYRRQYGFDVIALMPTNLYGPGDNFELQLSHVLPALIRKIHEAKMNGSKSVTIWGTGTPRREFLYVDDLADAAVFLMCNYSDAEIINVGVGHDMTIRELAQTISEVLGYYGQLDFDTSKPDGAPRKLLDVSRLTALGWTATTGIRQGISQTYEWYLQNKHKFEKQSAKQI